MDKAALRQRLMGTFLDEVRQHVQSLNRDLLAFERAAEDRRPPLVASLFRTVHSLKGAARAVGVTAVEEACHRLEGRLGAARDGARPLDAHAIQLLFKAADALDDAASRLREGHPLDEGALVALLPVLDRPAAAKVQAPGSAPPRPQAAPPAADPPASASPTQGILRVPSAKLDALLTGSGELLVARRRAAACQHDLAGLQADLDASRRDWRELETALRRLQSSPGRRLPRRAVEAFARAGERLRTLAQRVDQLTTRVTTETRALERAAGALDADIRRVRLFPFSQACEGLDRVVRDLALAAGKQVELAIEGRDVELDRSLLERTRDPVLHLVRNAVDHGIEPPDERRANGKPARATVTVSTALREGGVEIVVADDGRGLDLPAIRARARERGMAVPEDDRDAARLTLLPGFTTARVVTDLSGRGVGLDVVRHHVESLHGQVEIAFDPGRGTRVTLTLPLTVTTVRALLAAAGGQIYAVPAAAVRRLVRIRPADLASAGGRQVLLSNHAPLPVAALAQILALDPPPRPHPRIVTLMVLASAGQQAAVVVDELLAEEEVLVKGLGPRLRRLPHIAGATILPSGRVALILNAGAVVQSALARPPERAAPPVPVAREAPPPRRLIVVDDSPTTRSLERSLLEAAGYAVVAAADGDEAWRLLQESGADLVVADVEMPRMDGFALCRAIRASKRFRELPVVLVTALESDEDRRRGLDAGADAYLPKSAFDQQALLDTISQLL